LILTALDKINSLVNKVNKLDARIRKSSKCNTTNQTNENDKDDKRSSIESIDSEHTPVLGKKFIADEFIEPIAMPQQDYTIPTKLAHNSPVIMQMTENIKKWWNK
jgi:hypothetical protein